MKIRRIALEEFRRFKAPLVLDGLSDGINLFVGRNEAGKSTIAAALRAAFLERSRTKTVTDFAPWGVSGARPTVEVDFSIASNRYRLKKHFLTRSRCELFIETGSSAQMSAPTSTVRLEGESAEDALAALVGFDMPGKGQSQAKQAGIPGLLWVLQGEGQEIADPANHAIDHLREALTRLSGELASAEGDRLYAKVSAERAALLDIRAGKPKGIYREAEEALVAENARYAGLVEEKNQLDGEVDRLARLRSEHEQAERDRPWEIFERDAEAARARLVEVARAREAVDLLRRERDSASAVLESLLAQVGRDQEDADALARQSAQATALTETTRTAASALEEARRVLEMERSARALVQKRHALACARAERDDLRAQLARAEGESTRLTAAAEQAHALEARSEALKAELQALSLPQPLRERDMASLRACQQSLLTLNIRRESAATRLHFALPESDGTLLLDDSPLSGVGERLLTHTGVLHMPGHGSITIVPGGSDLMQIAQDIAEAEKIRDAILIAMGVSSLADAESKWSTYQQREREYQSIVRELTIHAPKGMATMLADQASASQQRDALRQRLSTLTTWKGSSDQTAAKEADEHEDAEGMQGCEPREQPENVDVWESVAQAQHALTLAEARVQSAGDKTNQAEAHFNGTAAQSRLLEEQLGGRLASFRDGARLAEREARARRLIESRSRSETLEQQLTAAVQVLDAKQPEMLEQDVRRLARSAAIARDAHQNRHNDLLMLSGKLEQAGARGLGEDVARCLTEVQRLSRRRDEIALRANGLDLLLRLLGEKRDAATRRLQAPLARRLNHYLGLLFPRATLRLGDDLLPVELQRANEEGYRQLNATLDETHERGSHMLQGAPATGGKEGKKGIEKAEDDIRLDALESLSFGTREQLGLLVRLAYADLLKESGRPTLLVLDDALVHADAARRGLMKRALFDAAERHQILMFTCHAEAWQDLGVVQRTLD